MVARRLLIATAWLLATRVCAAPLDGRIGAPIPGDQWRTLRTPHFNVHFEADRREVANEVAATAEAAHDRLTTLFDHHPQKKTELVINDNNDETNGAASPFPYHQITIYLRPPESGDLLSNQPWLEQLLTHEYTHVLHHDRVRGTGQVLRRLFGSVDALPLVFATYPQLWAPSWLAEGLAIRAESLGGQGRSNSAIYAAKMREALRHGPHTLAQESYEGYHPIRWPFGHVYLYGAWFFRFLDETWGPEKTLAYLAEYDDNLIPWRMDHRAKAVFGLSSQALWRRFESYLQQQLAEQIPLAGPAALVTTPWLNRLPTAGADGAIYYHHADLIGMPAIRRLGADGSDHQIQPATGVRFLDWHPDRGLLIGQRLLCDNRKRYDDILLLPSAGDTPRRLTRCGRIQQAAWHPDGERIIGVQLDGGRTRLVTISASDGHIEALFTPPAGDRLGRIAIAPDGATVAIQHHRPESGWNISLLSLPDRHLQPATHGRHIKSHPRFGRDGKTLYFLVHEAGHVELHRLSLDSGEQARLTDSRGYIDDYAISDDGRITLAEYTADGIVLRRMTPPSNPLPTTETDDTDTPPPLLPTMTSHLRRIRALPDQPYDPRHSMRPRGWLPIIERNDNHDDHIGLRLSGRDALGFHNWVLMPLWFGHNGAGHAGGLLSYDYDGRLLLAASRTIVAPSGDDTSRWDDENRLQLLLQLFHNRHDRGWKFFAGSAYERLIRHDARTTLHQRDQLAGMGLAYDSLHHYGQSITPTDGIRLSLIGEGYAGGSDHTGNAVIGTLTAIHHLGGNHHLLGQLTGGSGTAGIKPFSLGGEVNVLDDISGITPFGQRRFALRGYDDGAREGNHFLRATAAWHFPLATIYSGLLAPPLGIGSIHGNLFAEGAMVDRKAGKDGWLTGIGVELTADLLIGFDSFSIPVTLGFASGLDDERGDNRLYLRAGLAF